MRAEGVDEAADPEEDSDDDPEDDDAVDFSRAPDVSAPLSDEAADVVALPEDGPDPRESVR